MTNAKKKKDDGHDTSRAKRVIRLDDLDWTEDVVGGAAGKLVFGEPIGEENSLNTFLDTNSGKKGKGSL